MNVQVIQNNHIDNNNNVNHSQNVSDHNVIEEKIEKHIKNAEPILSNVLTPWQAFKNGFETAISSFIKLGNEGKAKKKIINDPLVKNCETQLVEHLIKSLLKDYNSVKFVKKEGKYLAICEGKIYQFSELFQHVDMNTVTLSEKELNKYHSLLDKKTLAFEPYLPSVAGKPTDEDFKKLDTEHLCDKLSLGEKEAINMYTSSAYSSMNKFLRGDIPNAIEDFSYYLPQNLDKSEKINQSIKALLLHCVMAVSGLNKMPDYAPEPDANGHIPKYLYRVENTLPDSVLAKRKWCVLDGGNVTFETGFISTAFKKPAEGFIGEDSKAGVMFKNLKGKKITCLSFFGNSEREVLIPPTPVRWLYEKDIVTDIYQNTFKLFIAKPVDVNRLSPPGATKMTYVSHAHHGH